MRNLLLAGLFAGILVLALAPAGDLPVPPVVAGTTGTFPAEGSGPPTVVELFTSQGCSSCPPADELLAQLGGRDDVVAIAYHVTYWDYLGWRDPFATEWGTTRQRRYVRALELRYSYTPQMVVDGAVDVVGSRKNEVAAALGASRDAAARRVPVALSRSAGGGALLISLPARSLAAPLDVWLVRYAGPRATEVRAGENRGRRLSNANIAREMRHLGKWAGEAYELRVAIPQDGEPDGGVAVLLQENGTGAIRGAAKLPLDG